MKPKPTEPTPPPLTYIDTLPPEEQASLRAFREEIRRKARERQAHLTPAARRQIIETAAREIALTEEESDLYQKIMDEMDKAE